MRNKNSWYSQTGHQHNMALRETHDKVYPRKQKQWERSRVNWKENVNNSAILDYIHNNSHKKQLTLILTFVNMWNEEHLNVPSTRGEVWHNINTWWTKILTTIEATAIIIWRIIEVEFKLESWAEIQGHFIGHVLATIWILCYQMVKATAKAVTYFEVTQGIHVVFRRWRHD